MRKVYKKIGETPLEALQRLRKNNPELAGERLSYAGRLDPMAAGILPVLVGKENDRRKEFLNQDKSYTFELLFGVKTDTFDLLGLPTLVLGNGELSIGNGELSKRRGGEGSPHFLCTVNDTNVPLTVRNLQSVCDGFIGEQEMSYPPYSSKTVMLNGTKTPLWKVARAGRLDEVILPEKTIQIYDMSVKSIKRLEKNYIIHYIIHQIEKVDGDFRQAEIINEWKKVFADINDHSKLPVAKFQVRCSAGTYIRRLVDRLGSRLGIDTTLFSLLRTDVGINK